MHPVCGSGLTAGWGPPQAAGDGVWSFYCELQGLLVSKCRELIPSSWLAALALVAGLLAYGLVAVHIASRGRSAVPSLKNLGFGTPVSATMVTGWTLERLQGVSERIVASVMVANSPQVILSLLYVLMNGVITSMYLAVEWSNFARLRKPLRVSSRRQGQRRTYFLQLPYRIGVPMLFISGVLHWLVSQSIFLAVVNIVSDFGESAQFSNVTCGFSPLAMILVLASGGAVLLWLLILSSKKMDVEMPIAGSCSAAISAACHDPNVKAGDELKPLMWGIVDAECVDDGGAVEHCAFSARFVRPVEEGKRYA